MDRRIKADEKTDNKQYCITVMQHCKASDNALPLFTLSGLTQYQWRHQAACDVPDSTGADFASEWLTISMTIHTGISCFSRYSAIIEITVNSIPSVKK